MAAPRRSAEDMAAVTPRKRSRGSTETDGSSFETPVKKPMMGFAHRPSPLKKPRNNGSASPIKWSSSSGDEMKENEPVAVKPALPRRLDISPLQAASIPVTAQSKSSGELSPKTASSYKPLIPVVSFYSKEKRYLTLVERKQLGESRFLGEGNRGEGLPAASRSEKVNVSRNTSIKPPKHATTSKHGKTLPKTLKKAKGGAPAGKATAEKENVNPLIKKKMDSPFRVLSMTVKPALKLQLGAAFFSARKRSHSKKPAVDGRSQQESDQPRPPAAAKADSADRNKALEAGEVVRRVPAPQQKGGEGEEGFTRCVNQEGDSACEGKASPEESGSTSGAGGSNAENAVSSHRDVGVTCRAR
ncbi:N-acetyltransferase ESCO2 [Patagioenas fasciata monilis]|uniref:N-acetyltransferase ESCO2 n=1 Tax=Patagioenas fasciata monilis TaxID=372326 RepID=A0A1V4JJ93_PATFA|nr:N-acetyltransferase ESCO2 [Patagioenas fasciata monilis]